MSVLPIVLIIAAVVILGGVIVVAIGRGGELAASAADVRPLDTDIVTAADVALLRPPAALWGYDMRATDDALNRVARTVTERDVEIADLRQQIADMRSGQPHPWEALREPPREPPREAGDPRHAAGPPDAAGHDAPEPDPGLGAPGPGSRPPALPFRRPVGGPTRPPAGEPWSAWERPGGGTDQEPGEYPETGTATGGRA